MNRQFINGFTMVSNKFISRISKMSYKSVYVYLALVSRINQESGTSEVWPSYTTIMEDTGFCRESISDALKELIS